MGGGWEVVGNIQPQPPTHAREPRRLICQTSTTVACLTVLPCGPVLITSLLCDSMSASSQSLGLAESQDLPSEDLKLEDPACAWIDLVESTRLPNLVERRESVNKMVFLAKNSHWTMEKWIAFGTGYESDTTDPFDLDHDAECECEGCLRTHANDQETLAKNAAHSMVSIGAGPLPKLARTKVTARPAACYQLRRCVQCGAEFATQRELLYHIRCSH